jgi:Icc-related predicted phosphoesterase
VKVVVVSDIHHDGARPTRPRWADRKPPAGDALLIAGDLTQGLTSIGRLERVLEWLCGLGSWPSILLVAGNHDVLLAGRDPGVQKLLSKYNIIYLENSGFEMDGIKFWGTPIGTYGRGEPFQKTGDALREAYQIPAGIDVLVTHMPPYGILDTGTAAQGRPHCGSPELRAAVEAAKPRFHVFGHRHHAGGQVIIEGTTYINACCIEDSPPGHTFVIEKMPRLRETS